MAKRRESKATRERKDDQIREIDRAARAKALLENPMLVSAFQALEGHYLGVILNSDEADTDEREVAFRMVRASAKLKQALTRMIESGDFSMIAREQDRKQRDAERD